MCSPATQKHISSSMQYLCSACAYNSCLSVWNAALIFVVLDASCQCYGIKLQLPLCVETLGNCLTKPVVGSSSSSSKAHLSATECHSFTAFIMFSASHEGMTSSLYTLIMIQMFSCHVMALLKTNFVLVNTLHLKQAVVWRLPHMIMWCCLACLLSNQQITVPTSAYKQVKLCHTRTSSELHNVQWGMQATGAQLNIPS